MVAPPPKRFKIVINPKSGKGKAVGLFKKHVQPILEASGCDVVDQIRDGHRGQISHVFVTDRRGAAIDEMQRIDMQDYDAILCVGGDGTVHEVINGLAKRDDSGDALDSLAIGTIPAGKCLPFASF